MSFFPRNEASDTGRPSIAEGSETTGNGSPGLNPMGSGENRAHTGFDPGFDCPAANGAAPTANSNASIAERICGDDMRGLRDRQLGLRWAGTADARRRDAFDEAVLKEAA